MVLDVKAEWHRVKINLNGSNNWDRPWDDWGDASLIISSSRIWLNFPHYSIALQSSTWRGGGGGGLAPDSSELNTFMPNFLDFTSNVLADLKRWADKRNGIPSPRNCDVRAGIHTVLVLRYAWNACDHIMPLYSLELNVSPRDSNTCPQCRPGHLIKRSHTEKYETWSVMRSENGRSSRVYTFA